MTRTYTDELEERKAAKKGFWGKEGQCLFCKRHTRLDSYHEYKPINDFYPMIGLSSTVLACPKCRRKQQGVLER